MFGSRTEKMRTGFFLLLLVVAGTVFPQTAKKEVEKGEKFEKKNELDAAIAAYSKAIEMDPGYLRAYVHRAGCYEKAGKRADAAGDYKTAFVMEPKEAENAYQAGRILMEMQRYSEAREMLEKALLADKDYKAAREAEINVLLQMKDFKQGLAVAQAGIDHKKNAESYFYYGLMNDSLKDLASAEKYYKLSIGENSKYYPAVTNLAFVLVKRGKFDEAMVNCAVLLKANPDDTRALFARSLVYSQKLEFQSAIGDLTRAISLNPRDLAAYKERAKNYEKMGQVQEAINDYSAIIGKNRLRGDAYFGRAAAFEKTKNLKFSIDDYRRVVELNDSNLFVSKELATGASNRLYDLCRESDKPEIEIMEPKIEENVIKVMADKKHLSLSGKIKDASRIAEIVASSGKVKFIKNSRNPVFTIAVDSVTSAKYLELTVRDEYKNAKTIRLEIRMIETEAPEMEIEIPYRNKSNELLVVDESEKLRMEGRVKDASLIASISFNGVLAAFNRDSLNPQFTANLDISKKTEIIASVKDVHGNEATQTFKLNRDGVIAAENNPMGNTWAVFIENTHYNTFPALESPAKDVELMNSTFAGYKIGRLITKKNLTKQEMEDFFTMELRDNIRNSNVTSLLIWYAGHGKFVNPTSYWVPVDGTLKDESSYYNINNLRLILQTYDKLTHILVITDASEAGSAFYEPAQPVTDEEGNKCADNSLVRLKSAQVFTSANFKHSSGNSYFAKEFAALLSSSEEPCLSLDKIVKKVGFSLTKTGRQGPKYGRIKDLPDEGGSFFFYKK